MLLTRDLSVSNYFWGVGVNNDQPTRIVKGYNYTTQDVETYEFGSHSSYSTPLTIKYKVENGVHQMIVGSNTFTTTPSFNLNYILLGSYTGSTKNITLSNFKLKPL